MMSIPANVRYISIMSFASGLSLARGFFIAGILDLPSFGRYITLIAVGMFSSSLISFGETERTFKAFPRLWVARRRHEIIKRTEQSLKLMVLRVGVVLLLLLVCVFVDDLKSLVWTGLLIVLVALSAAVSSLYASAIRATGEVDLLARNTLMRALIVIVLAGLGSYVYNWQGAILGEVAGTLLGTLITRHSVIGQINWTGQNSDVVCENDGEKIKTDSGLWLFFSVLLASAPAYLDRVFVSIVFGEARVGTFGFLMLFVTGVNTFTGIIIQKIGPNLVKMEYLGNSITAQVRYVFRWLSLIWCGCLLGIISTGFALVLGPAQFFFEKFHLDLNLLAATAALCFLQVSVMVDFIMISHNQERAIFFSICWYLLVIGLVVLVVLWLKLLLVNFIWLLVFAKFTHILAQVGFIGKVFYGRSSGVI